MNRFMEEQWTWIEGSHAMRSGIMATLTDADLAFSPGGQNMTLGELCKEFGEIEHSYIESIKTRKQDWSYRHTEAGLTTSVAQLKAWYQQLDDDLKATVSALSDEELQQTIDRGMPMPINMQLEVYLQALLIFFGKVTIFLRAMDKPLPDAVQQWIG